MSAVAMKEISQATLTGAGRVLIADDQPHILEALQILLRNCGFATETVSHPAGLLSALESSTFDVVLMDLNYTRDTTGGGEGLDLVSRIRSIDSVVPIVVMTAWSTVDLGCPDGDAIPIEERDPGEVLHFAGARVAPAVRAENPAFDVTPARLVSGIVTERGEARPPSEGALERLASRA